MAAPASIHRASLLVRMVRSYQLYLLLLPTIALVFVFQYIPMYGVTIAFKNFKPHLGIIGSDWIGLRHFIRFFESPSFWRLIRNTIFLSGYELLVGFPIPIMLALMMNMVTGARFKRTVQMVTYAPHFISTVVIVGMLGVFLSKNFGLTLFSEGLITEEFFTNTGSDFTPRSRSVPPISGYWGSYFITAPVEEFYDPLPPLMGPTGVRRYRSQPVRLQKNVFTIFSKFEYPEALVRFIDPWADDTFSVEASYGGPLIKQEADGTRTVTGRGVDWFEHGPHNFFPTYVSKRAADKVNWTGEQGNRDLYIREIYAPHIWPQERHFAYITYTDEEQEELAVSSTEIANYIKTSIAKWMVDGGVEEGWNDYLKELDRLGLDQVMEIFQTAYDRFHGN